MKDLQGYVSLKRHGRGLNNIFTLKKDFFGSQVSTSECTEGTVFLVLQHKTDLSMESIECTFLHSVLSINKYVKSA